VRAGCRRVRVGGFWWRGRGPTAPAPPRPSASAPPRRPWPSPPRARPLRSPSLGGASANRTVSESGRNGGGSPCRTADAAAVARRWIKTEGSGRVGEGSVREESRGL
jgi:hypothetical protein